MTGDDYPTQDRRPGTESGATEDEPARSIDSAALFHGARVIVIRHGDSEYRLRSTSKGKLLLTK